MEVFGKIMAFAIWYPTVIVWHAFAFIKLWGWFAVPALGVEPIGVVSAIGLIMIAAFLTRHENGYDMVADKGLRYAVIFSFIRPALTLGLGYIVHLFA